MRSADRFALLTHLLQNMRSPVKVLLVCGQRAAGVAEGRSALEEEEEETAELEVKGSSPSCSRVSGLGDTPAP